MFICLFFKLHFLEIELQTVLIPGWSNPHENTRIAIPRNSASLDTGILLLAGFTIIQTILVGTGLLSTQEQGKLPRGAGNLTHLPKVSHHMLNPDSSQVGPAIQPTHFR